MQWLKHPGTTGTLAALAILANLVIALTTHAWQQDQRQQEWQTAVENRLTRLETKMDRILLENARR